MKTTKYQPHSQLTYRQIEPQNGSSTAGGALITLHGHMRTLDELIPLAVMASPEMHIVAPEAARGVYRSIQIIGKTWFGGTPSKPESASFGDSLAQLERFIYDVQARSGEGAPKPWLLGYEQGAVLASTIALIAPDLISGVVAIDGGLPSFSNDSLLEPMEGTLPILFIANSQDEDHQSQVEGSASQLKTLGHQVTAQRMPISTDPESPAAHAAQAFLQAHRQN